MLAVKPECSTPELLTVSKKKIARLMGSKVEDYAGLEFSTLGVSRMGGWVGGGGPYFSPIHPVPPPSRGIAHRDLLSTSIGIPSLPSRRAAAFSPFSYHPPPHRPSPARAPPPKESSSRYTSIPSPKQHRGGGVIPNFVACNELSSTRTCNPPNRSRWHIRSSTPFSCMPPP
jgi:hypothetical protein